MKNEEFSRRNSIGDLWKPPKTKIVHFSQKLEIFHEISRSNSMDAYHFKRDFSSSKILIFAQNGWKMGLKKLINFPIRFSPSGSSFQVVCREIAVFCRLEIGRKGQAEAKGETIEGVFL